MGFTPKQQEAIDAKGNILVSASAGSGKTTVLAERIADLCLKEHINIDKFVVVTFTRLAASEMKAKIIKKLETKRTEENQAFLDEQLVLIEKANICTLDSFNNSLVKDYFYVLGDYDIEPNFTIMDNVDKTILEDKVLESVFAKHYEADDKEFEKLLDMYANYRGDDELKSEIKLLYSYASNMPYPDKTLAELKDFYSGKIEVEDTKYYKFFKKHSLQILKSVKSIYDKYSDVPFIQDDMPYLTKTIDALENGGYDDVRNSLQKEFAQARVSKKLYEDEDEKGFIVATRDKYKKYIVEKLSAKILRHSKEELDAWMTKMSSSTIKMIELAEEFSSELLKEKCKENRFIFDDIAHFAIKILKKDDGSDTKIADTLKEQFEFIIVDEYQDTNNLQETILKSISRSGKDSNVFMVGDVKQSIYKFRNAEPQIFTNKYNEFKKNSDEFNKKIDLNTNFRSREEVIDSVNFVFDKLMQEAVGGIVYDEEMALHYGGLYGEKKDDFDYTSEWIEIDEVEVKPKSSEEDDKDEYEKELKEIEILVKKKKNELFSSFAVAKKIEELMSSGFEVYEDGKFRPLKYSDIAILTRKNESALNFYEALKSKGIPSSLISDGQVLLEYEIAQVISILKLLDNPYDNVSMITVLYSEMFNFTPEELLELKRSVHSSNWIEIVGSKNVPENLKEKVDYFNNLLKDLKEFSLKHSIEDLIKEIYTRTNLQKYITGLTEMKSKSSSMRVLLEYTRKYESYGTRNLYDYIKDIDKILDANEDIDKNEEVETGDTVNVVTMHKSKGLEYPIVFIPSLERNLGGKPEMTSTRVDKELGYISKFIDADAFLRETNFYHAIMGIKQSVDDIAEEIRILYVAMTRAKEKLYLVSVPDKKDKNYDRSWEISNGIIDYSYLVRCQNFADYLKPIIESKDSQNYFKQSSFDSYNIVVDETKQIKSEIVDYIVDVDEILNDDTFKYPYENSKNITKKVSVSEIKRRHMVDELDDELSEEDLMKTRIKLSSEEVVKQIKRKDIDELAPNEKGTIMHKLVKILDGDDLDAEFDKLIQDGIFTENELSQINKDNIYRYFDSEVFNDIKKSNFVKRELPFMLKKKACEVFKDETSEDEVIIQGIIDCIYEKDGKIVVLDYKTDKVDENNKDERIEEIKNMYKIQLDIYAEAIRNIYDKEIDKKILYLFSSGDTVEV